LADRNAGMAAVTLLQDITALTLALDLRELALCTALSMKRGRSSRVEPGGPWPVDGAHLSIASWLEEQVARSSGWPSSDEGRQATRALVGGLAGAKGC
jgi:hypothetical protein